MSIFSQDELDIARACVAIVTAIRAGESQRAEDIAREIGWDLALLGIAGMCVGLLDALDEYGKGDLLERIGLAAA